MSISERVKLLTVHTQHDDVVHIAKGVCFLTCVCTHVCVSYSMAHFLLLSVCAQLSHWECPYQSQHSRDHVLYIVMTSSPTHPHLLVQCTVDTCLFPYPAWLHQVRDEPLQCHMVFDPTLFGIVWGDLAHWQPLSIPFAPSYFP